MKAAMTSAQVTAEEVETVSEYDAYVKSRYVHTKFVA